MLDEFIENFHKPEGLSAVIDEHFEKFDKPDKKHESDEYVCGTWASEEVVDDSGYLHGWLDRHGNGWQARLIFYDTDEEPWYSQSCGEEPEYMGDIHVRLLSETKIETQIKFSDEAEWLPPVVLILTERGVARERDLWGPLA